MVGRDGQEKMIQRTFAGEVGSHQKSLRSNFRGKKNNRSKGPYVKMCLACPRKWKMGNIMTIWYQRARLDRKAKAKV